MSSYRSPAGQDVKPTAYQAFMGLDTSRDDTAMETNNNQHLVVLDNGYCDWRGQIVRDPAIRFRAGDHKVIHARFFAPGQICWAERRGDGVWLSSELNHTVNPNWPRSARPTSTIFNRRAHFFAAALTPKFYDGAAWRETNSAYLKLIRPAFGVTVARRLAVAGIIGQETVVDFSRVDNDDYFSEDEPGDSNNVLRAARLDVGNLLDNADRITGLGSFEQSGLAIFTSDRCLIYQIDPDLSRWQIDNRANIRIGCISHNTIANAGSDILFCSRTGVHSVSRSQDNGITVFSQPMSQKVELLYRQLVLSVDDLQDISAVWDQDQSQYHIYFPQKNSDQTLRLTLTLAPGEDQQAGTRMMPLPKWSTGSGFNATCGAFLAGRLAIGTNEGVYDVLDPEIETNEATTPKLVVTTPILWQGALDSDKESTALIVQAAGKGELLIEAFNDRNQDLGTLRVDLSDADDNVAFTSLPLNQQYELKFDRRYRGLRLRFTATGVGLFRLSGFAVVLRKQK
jgi:hypothetical protein